MARPECQPPEVPGARLCFGEPSLWPAKTAHHGRPRHPTKRDKPPVHCPPSRSSMPRPGTSPGGAFKGGNIWQENTNSTKTRQELRLKQATVKSLPRVSPTAAKPRTERHRIREEQRGLRCRGPDRALIPSFGPARGRHDCGDGEGWAAQPEPPTLYYSCPDSSLS
jgi:hypothetical protein